MMANTNATAAEKRKRVDEEDRIQDGNREKRMRPLEVNPAGDSQQSTLSIVKRKRGRPSSSSLSSNNSSIRIIHWQLLPCKSSNKESASLITDNKKIRKPMHLITADKPNDYTIPTTDVVFAQKFMSITPFKFRGRKPLSVPSSNPEPITSTDAKKDDNKDEPTIVN